MADGIKTIKGALSDISRLVAGANRAEVALDALGDEPLKPTQIVRLKALAAKYESAATTGPGVTTHSVLDLCGYKKTDAGTIICTRPGNMSLVDVFKMANAECERLGIAPATWGGSMLEWFEENTCARQTMLSREEVTGLVNASLNKSREKQERVAKKAGGIASIEMAALANVLEHIATRGKHDLFEGHWVRTQAPDVALARDDDGLYAHLCFDAFGNAEVGCAASRNLEKA